MSFIAAHLTSWWFIHSAILEAPDDETVDDDNQPVGGYLDPVTILRCRLVDASSQQIIDAQLAGIPIVHSVLLVPPTLQVINRSKLSAIKHRDTDAVIEDGTFEVVGETTTRSAEGDENRNVLLRRVG